MEQHRTIPLIPASFFGMVLGCGGLAGAWRQAGATWHISEVPAEALELLTLFVWSLLMTLFVAKWVFERGEAKAEAKHPVQCCFVGLVGVSTMVVSGCILPHTRATAVPLFAVGALFTIAFMLWRSGELWKGGRHESSTTAVLYLPAVAGSFVTATMLGKLGFADWGQLVFGAGFFSWLSIESVLLHRLYTAEPLGAAVRPTIGIQLAPPTVGAVAWLSVCGTDAGPLPHAMLGYGLLQVLLLARLWTWIREAAPLSAFWGFSFGVTAISTAAVTMVGRGDTIAIQILAPSLFIGSNAFIALLIVATLRLLLLKRLLPPRASS